MNTESLLTIKNLSLRFPQTGGYIAALQQINFSIARGETLALVGESGSGKTLTGFSILQILPPSAQISDQSQIVLDGKDLLSLPEKNLRKIRGKRVGIIFQEASMAFNPVLTIAQQIDETLKKHLRLSATERQQRILSLLHEVGIHDPVHCAASYPHTLSGGMRQRAMIAMALAPEPDLLIADEPTTAVDVTLQAQILQLLRNIQQKNKMAMLFITHDLGVVYDIADRVAVIEKGHIVEQQTATNFFTQPQHPYSQQLFAALPTWEKRERPPQTATSTPVLAVENLRIYFPIKRGILQRTKAEIKAVDNVSFSLSVGQTYALVGESGSGKTTLAKGIVHLVQLTTGEIHFRNQSISQTSSPRLHSWRGDLQMIFQDPYASLNPRLRVNQIIAEGMLVQKKARNLQECQPVIDELLQRVGLSLNVKNRFPHEFSGGQRQRICIARALAMRPKLIICDEPTSALDVIVQMDILHLLNELQKDLGLSYLLITHNIAVVAFLADYVGVMQQGRIIEQGEVEKVLFSPQHAYTQRLLAAVPKYDFK